MVGGGVKAFLSQIECIIDSSSHLIIITHGKGIEVLGFSRLKVKVAMDML